MNTAQMRLWLVEKYGRNSDWMRRVNRMSDDQVQAIYFRILRDNKSKRT